jgi:hypothetical protein
MKVFIDKTEWCDIYELSDDLGEALEVEDAKAQSWMRVFDEFWRVQREIADLVG